MNSILTTPSELSKPIFNAIQGERILQALPTIKVLVIGAGGLGCEILKTLALSGIKEIHVIDLDTIDVTNLNRQFLFRKKDVGRYKAEVAAEFIMNRIPSCKVIPYKKRIQEFPIDFYKDFPVIIAGLDNVEARRWLNRVVVSMVERDDQGNIIEESRHYLIDGGTEGLNGQARVIAPFETACYECTINQLPKQVQYQMCTIANTPRIPEHCIAYAYEILWDKENTGQKLDKDDYDHMNWIYQRALQIAQQNKIEGVTFKLTQGVVKNIIPAVASTNALIASLCVTECFKLLTGLGSQLSNYFQWVGQAEYSGVNINVIEQERIENCETCQIFDIQIQLNKQDTLQQLIEQLPENSELSSKGETLKSNNVYRQDAFEPLLKKTFAELISENLIDPETPLICFDRFKTIKVHLKLND